MRAVVQRVRSAAVFVADAQIAAIPQGLAILLGVAIDDRPEDGERLAAKILALRIFDDDRGRLDRTVLESGGNILVVPQFTLYGDVRHGRRPDFAHAAPPDVGRRLFDAFCGVLRGEDATVAAGRFGANMRVVLEDDGPVTVVVSTDGWAEGDLGRKGG
ncbi:MAG TPA: D-aminoacyl-tRNA deacylase [Candidatus Limnocylindria bacterium]|nr:D-aminoacyl-tRNA deacylase [Candidatus Limnocylindria bacterium]